MFNKRFSFIMLFFVLTLIFPSLGVSAKTYTEEFSKTYTVKPGTKIKVYNINGSIRISKWDKDEVEVNALKSTKEDEDELEKVKIEVSINGDMEIKTKYIEKRAKVGVSYEIKVPADIIVSYVESSNGEIGLKGTKGPSKVRTSNGRIEVENIEGDIDLVTSNGKIEVEDVEGVLNALTSNGSIKVAGVAGISKVVTSNGAINIEIPDIKGDEVEIRTSLGSIDLYISPDLNADIEMDTSLGSISYHDIPLVVSEKEKTHVEGKLGKVGKGGPKITVSTSLGSIDLYKL